MDTDREVVDVIKEGVELYTSDGERVGHIDEIAPDYLVVSETDLGADRVYIPRSEVGRESDGAMYLNVGRDQLESIASTEPLGGGMSSREDVSTGTDYATTTQATSRTDESWVDTDTTDRDSDRIRVHEEELQAQKVAREAGAVEVTKDVVEEERTLDVPVSREEVNVRRVPVTEGTADTGNAFQTDSIRVPIVEEEVQVQKTPRVVEELEISKSRTQDTERVSDTVRKERVNVDEQGNVDLDRDRVGETR